MEFNVKSFGFSIENANYLAKAASLAYRDFNCGDDHQKSVSDEIQGWGFQPENTGFFDVKGTQAFLAADDEKLIVAFRGTEPDVLEDWVTDAKIRKTAGPFGDVHRGFMQALNYIWPDIEATIEGFLNKKNRTVWITGHSLGGALATLATAMLQNREQPVNVNGLPARAPLQIPE